MSNNLRKPQNRLKGIGEKESTSDTVMVHGAMKYMCERCGRSWWMFLEKGIEEFDENHKPSPFIIRCKCGGSARDVSGICKIPGAGYKPLPDGESYFANRKESDCGVPVLR